jgi:hypothetical protein
VRPVVTYHDPLPESGKRPPVSSSAHAFVSEGMRRGPTIIGALFEGMMDDGTSAIASVEDFSFRLFRLFSATDDSEVWQFLLLYDWRRS